MNDATEYTVTRSENLAEDLGLDVVEFERYVAYRMAARERGKRAPVVCMRCRQIPDECAC